MFTFNLEKFLVDKRLSRLELSQQLNISFYSISTMVRRGTIKPKILREIEKKYGDASEYLTSHQDEQKNFPVSA